MLSKQLFDNFEKMYPATDYNDDNVSIKVVKIIESYTKLINYNTWRKR